MKNHEINPTPKPKLVSEPKATRPEVDFVAWLEADLARLELKYAGFVTDVSTRVDLKSDRRRSE